MDGIIYILKFVPQFHHAKFYVGWCKPRGLMHRLKQHRTGQGAHITRAAIQQGHRLELVIDFPGTRDQERRIKNGKNTPKFVERWLNQRQDIQQPRSAKCDNRDPLPPPYRYLDEKEDAMPVDLSHVDLVALIEKDTGQKLRREPKCFVGPCPWCGEGEDRFVVWDQKWWCRRCEKSGDAINWVRERDGLSFQEACKKLGVSLASNRPNSRTIARPHKRDEQPHDNIKITPERESAALIDPVWGPAARAFAQECHVRLMVSATKQRDYLYQRGISEASLLHMQIGYNHKDQTLHWGATKVFAPAGIVFPWYDEKEALVRVNFRCDSGPHKYRLADGSAQAFYLGERLKQGCHAIIVEGEIDALTILQAFDYHPDMCPLATGSVTHGRIARLIARLGLAARVQIAFDNDEAGQNACAFWTSLSKKITKAHSLFPHKDVNALYCATLRDPENDGKEHLARAAVRAWIEGKN